MGITDGGPLENQHLLKGYLPKKCEKREINALTLA